MFRRLLYICIVVCFSGYVLNVYYLNRIKPDVITQVLLLVIGQGIEKTCAPWSTADEPLQLILHFQIRRAYAVRGLCLYSITNELLDRVEKMHSVDSCSC